MFHKNHELKHKPIKCIQIKVKLLFMSNSVKREREKERRRLTNKFNWKQFTVVTLNINWIVKVRQQIEVYTTSTRQTKTKSA